MPYVGLRCLPGHSLEGTNIRDAIPSTRATTAKSRCTTALYNEQHGRRDVPTEEGGKQHCDHAIAEQRLGAHGVVVASRRKVRSRGESAAPVLPREWHRRASETRSDQGGVSASANGIGQRHRSPCSCLIWRHRRWHRWILPSALVRPGPQMHPSWNFPEIACSETLHGAAAH